MGVFDTETGSVGAAESRVERVSVKGEFRCRSCGYGIVLHHDPPACPMCRGEEWESAPWRPFTREPDVETALRRT